MTEASEYKSMSDTFRDKAETYAKLGLHVTAKFYADKAVSLSRSRPSDVLRLARVYALSSQHRRALHLLNESGLTEKLVTAKLLAAQCLYAVGEYDECLFVLDIDEENSTRDLQPVDRDRLLRSGRLASESPISNYDRFSPGSHRDRTFSHSKRFARNSENDVELDDDSNEIQAALCVMRARAFEELENFPRAVWWYKKAMQYDLYCYEAFERLAETCLETADGVNKFTEQLCGNSFMKPKETVSAEDPSVQVSTKTHDSAASEDSARRNGLRRKLDVAESTPTKADSWRHVEGMAPYWVRAFYHLRADHSGPLLAEQVSSMSLNDVASKSPSSESLTTRIANCLKLVTSETGMQDNVDILKLLAIRLHESLDFQGSIDLTRTILRRDPYVEPYIMLMHLASLVELGDRQELFVLAHSLVDRCPRDSVSWLAVGYYYFVCDKYELAKRYLQKATSLSSRLVPAWLAIGHAFAAQDESDQAMAGYRTAARLYPGSQSPQLFMGMEYARQSSFAHASTYFQAARTTCPSDPAPQHELGVVLYRMGDVQSATCHFQAALSLWEEIDNRSAVPYSHARRIEAVESTLFNLGHCYRRQRRFEDAKVCYERALGLRPMSHSTCCALGMTFHAMGDPASAISMYHRALRHHPDDSISATLLDRALQDCSDFIS